MHVLNSGYRALRYVQRSSPGAFPRLFPAYLASANGWSLRRPRGVYLKPVRAHAFCAPMFVIRTLVYPCSRRAPRRLEYCMSTFALRARSLETARAFSSPRYSKYYGLSNHRQLPVNKDPPILGWPVTGITGLGIACRYLP